jgi:hypothetical protein
MVFEDVEDITKIVLLREAVTDLVPVLVGDRVPDVEEDIVFDPVMVVDAVRDEEVVKEGVTVIVTVGVCDKYAQTRFVVTVQATVSDWPIRQAVQAVQVAAFVVVLYVDPATQAVHPVFANAVQALVLLVPAGHTEQAEQTLFVVTVHAVD